MEIFMSDNGFNGFKILIGGAFFAGQHARGIKDIKAFVFHGAEIEMINGDNHENIKIIFATKNLFIPFHGTLEGIKGIVHLVDIMGLHKNFKGDITARLGGELVLFMGEITGHQCK